MRRASRRVRAVPVCRTPARSRARSVVRMPSRPWSTEWFDAVEQAHSGHPGAPMALAPVAYQLWQQELRYDPSHPIWPNRDRFVLSNGHASMLLYGLLHLSGTRRVTTEYQVEDGLAVARAGKGRSPLSGRNAPSYARRARVVGAA